jgi:DNA-binding NtrC family response regulator
MSELLPEKEPAPQLKHILIVEDNVNLRFTLAAWLRLLNYIVFEASTADEAVTLLNSQLNVDFVITDVEMPGTMNGLDLARYIKKSFPGLYVIGVSGNNFQNEFKQEDILFFRKPYDLEDISSHITKTLADSNNENKV